MHWMMGGKLRRPSYLPRQAETQSIVGRSPAKCENGVNEPDGKVMTVAGDPDTSGYKDGTGREAKFNKPHGVALDRTGGAIIVVDSYNHRIRKIGPGGVVTTLAGTGKEGFQDGDGLVHNRILRAVLLLHCIC